MYVQIFLTTSLFMLGSNASWQVAAGGFRTAKAMLGNAALSGMPSGVAAPAAGRGGRARARGQRSTGLWLCVRTLC